MQVDIPPPLPIPDLDFDEGIGPIVKLFRRNGIRTFASCEGGSGHTYPEPTIRFEGGPEEGFRAYALALYNGYEVDAVRRCWEVVDHELTGPFWEITFVL